MTIATEMHRAQWKTIATRDWDRLRTLYHPDYQYTDVTGTTHDGYDVPLAALRRLHTAFPDVTFSFDGFHGDHELSFTEIVYRGTHQAPFNGIDPAGATVTTHACHVITLRDHRIHRERDYFDAYSLLSQIGGIPEPRQADDETPPLPRPRRRLAAFARHS